MDVDSKPFAAGMDRPGKPPWNGRAGRQALEKH
jgi:hypothetical protein